MEIQVFYGTEKSKGKETDSIFLWHDEIAGGKDAQDTG